MCSTLEGIKRRAGEKKHIEFVVAIHLVLSVFIPRHQQNVIQHIGLSPRHANTTPQNSIQQSQSIEKQAHAISGV
jgi:hypothetical protein